MRWIWIDRILVLEKQHRCVAIKNISLAEELLRDHLPATECRPAIPVMPNTLVIEGMAQAAGILVGATNGFTEKVILAKISKASFFEAARPGFSLHFDATIERLDRQGAATHGTVQLIDPENGSRKPMAEIDLLFSHVDQNMAGLEFPDRNFVFTGQFMDLLRQSGFGDLIPTDFVEE